ncbi:MAG: hypothetical protein RLZZ135_1384 [Cyanobacteriota bacterium]|jgi:hypothetical protein
MSFISRIIDLLSLRELLEPGKVERCAPIDLGL